MVNRVTARVRPGWMLALRKQGLATDLFLLALRKTWLEGEAHRIRQGLEWRWWFSVGVGGRCGRLGLQSPCLLAATAEHRLRATCAVVHANLVSDHKGNG
jgi:hypothetical protein